MAIIGLAIPPDVSTLLKGIKNIAPKVGSIELPGGVIVAMAGLAALTDTFAEAQISRHTDRKTKTDPHDGVRVLKVSEAIKCVDATFRSPTYLLQLCKDITSVIVDPGGFGLKLDAAGPVIECIRSKALKQTNPRTFKRDTSHGRPARGHGKGKTLHKK